VPELSVPEVSLMPRSLTVAPFDPESVVLVSADPESLDPESLVLVSSVLAPSSAAASALACSREE
jgi:hypothetical protein